MVQAITSTTTFFACASTDKCLWDSAGHFSCATGHRGLMCRSCEPGYAFLGDNCVPCWTQGESWAATAALMVGCLLLVVKVVRNAGSAKSKTTATVRILLNWIQVVSPHEW